jgi:hypothetical protein
MAKTRREVEAELNNVARGWLLTFESASEWHKDATAGDIQKLRQDLLAACIEWQIQAPCNHKPMPIAVGVNQRVYCSECSKLLEERRPNGYPY